MRKFAVRILCLLLCFCLLLAAAGCQSTSQVLLTIDGHTVTRGIFNFYAIQAVNYYMSISEDGTFDPREEVDGQTMADYAYVYACTQLGREYAMLHLGLEDGYNITEDTYTTVKENLAASKEEYGAETLTAYYKTCHMSEDDYIEISAVFEVEQQIETALFAEGGKYYLSDERIAELTADFNDNYYHVYCITIDKNNSSGNDQLASAEEIRALMMDEDADLETISDTYSTVSSADADDDAYIQVSADTDATVVNALKNTPAGSVSEVVATEDSYIIFAVLEKEEEYLTSLIQEEVDETMEEMLDAVLDDMEIIETIAFDNYNVEDIL